MRKTQLTFFLILVLLTGILIFIIVGESDWMTNSPVVTDASITDKQTDSEDNIDLDQPAAEADLVALYKQEVEDIFYKWQQKILRSSVDRQQAAEEIRRELLELTQIPRDLQQIHLQLVMALNKDISGEWSQARQLYRGLEVQYEWLSQELNNWILQQE